VKENDEMRETNDTKFHVLNLLTDTIMDSYDLLASAEAHCAFGNQVTDEWLSAGSPKICYVIEQPVAQRGKIQLLITPKRGANRFSRAVQWPENHSFLIPANFLNYAQQLARDSQCPVTITKDRVPIYIFHSNGTLSMAPEI
jgi:hypothetical protein